MKSKNHFFLKNHYRAASICARPVKYLPWIIAKCVRCTLLWWGCENQLFHFSMCSIILFVFERSDHAKYLFVANANRTGSVGRLFFKNHRAAFSFAGPVRYCLWIIVKCVHSFVDMWHGNQIFHFYMFSIIFNNILHIFNNPFVFWPCKVSHCCKRTVTRQHLKTITHYSSFKTREPLHH